VELVDAAMNSSRPPWRRSPAARPLFRAFDGRGSAGGSAAAAPSVSYRLGDDVLHAASARAS